MQANNQVITSMARSMGRSLKNEHGITVPHSALRAVLLQAQGLNPHAFADANARAVSEDVKTLQQLVNEAPNFFHPSYDFDGEKVAWLQKAGLVSVDSEATPAMPIRTLHLAHDSLGCLNRLALDAEGTLMVPEDFTFTESSLVVSVNALIPRVSKYGMPDYLRMTGGFFQDSFGLGSRLPLDLSYEDLGDDSGDTCFINVEMSDKDWSRIVLAALSESSGTQDAISEWTGLHYKQDFSALSKAKKVEWTVRYLEMLEEASTIHHEPAPVSGIPVNLEYVYPDQDGDYLPAMLNLATGVVTPKEPLAQQLHDELQAAKALGITLRIWVDIGNDEPEVGDGQDYSVTGDSVDGNLIFKISGTNMREIRSQHQQ